MEWEIPYLVAFLPLCSFQQFEETEGKEQVIDTQGVLENTSLREKTSIDPPSKAENVSFGGVVPQQSHTP